MPACSPNDSPQRIGWPLALLAAVLGAALYTLTLRNGYVFDDVVVVRDNVIVREGRYAEAVTEPFWPRTEGVRDASNWRPLATLSLVLERDLFRAATPMVHHAGNVGLYALVVLALFPLARRLTGGDWPAFAACVLFAVWPAHAEVVCPIVGRTDLLAALGVLLGLECYLRYRDEAGVTWLALGVSAWAVGLAGKESAAPLLLLLPAADWLVGGRRLRDLFGRRALAWLPFAAVAVVYVAARLAVLGDASFQHANAVDYTPGQRLVFAARNAVVSLGLLVAPTRFHHLMTTLPEAAPFSYPDPEGLAAAAYLLGGLVAAGGWLGLVRRAPKAAFLWMAAVVTWLPTSGLLPASAGVSLRFLFMPTAFAAIGLGAVLQHLRHAVERPVSLVPAAVAVVAVTAATLSVLRTGAWRNNETLYLAVLAEAPRCFTAHHSLASWYALRRPPDLPRARAHYREAIRITGDTDASFLSRLNLAITWEQGTSGRRYSAGANLDKAAQSYDRLIERFPDRWEPHLNLALVLEQLRRPAETLPHYQRVLALAPEHPQRAEIERRITQLRQ